jgi:hypothetical protein
MSDVLFDFGASVIAGVKMVDRVQLFGVSRRGLNSTTSLQASNR